MKKAVLLFLFIILIQNSAAQESNFTVVFDFGNGESFEKCYTCSEETYGPMPTGINGAEILFDYSDIKDPAVVCWIYYDGQNWISVSESAVPEKKNHTLYAVWDQKTEKSETVSGVSFEKNQEDMMQFLLKILYLLPAVTLIILFLTVFKIKHTDR